MRTTVNMKKRVLSLVLSCLVAIPVLTACQGSVFKTKINAIDGLTITFSGFNEYGVATLDNTLSWKPQAIEALKLEDEESMAAAAKIANIESAITYKLDKTEDLKNGDTITATAIYDNKAVESFGIELTGTEKTFTVEGLEEPKEVDLFADVAPTYNGYAPFVTVQFSNENGINVANNFVKFTFTQSSDMLKNGDTITATATVDEEALKRSGFYPESLTKTYTVEGITTLLTDVSQISEENKQAMIQAGTDSLIAFFATFVPTEPKYATWCFDVADRSNDKTLMDAYDVAYNNYFFWGGGEPPTFSQPNPITCTDMYVISPKAVESGEDAYNIVYLVFSVHLIDSVIGERDVYCYVKFGNIMETADGDQTVTVTAIELQDAYLDKNLAYQTYVTVTIGDNNVSELSLQTS